ncbi:UNKNOWN [Stylonychia lemnae]|uniref:Uncharacterized protein n=1 Tax=Stylonychia lemnae TaxID=5949 RepID=A0A078AQT2_STYLE|nr:UNKNOWN [Stylonychia lemnae]|eukprot:CDW84291.1 UNKNOWN [Stylonychia lemnae]
MDNLSQQSIIIQEPSFHINNGQIPLQIGLTDQNAKAQLILQLQVNEQQQQVTDKSNQRLPTQSPKVNGVGHKRALTEFQYDPLSFSTHKILSIKQPQMEGQNPNMKVVKMDYYRNMPEKKPIYKIQTKNLGDYSTDLNIFQNKFISTVQHRNQNTTQQNNSYNPLNQTTIQLPNQKSDQSQLLPRMDQRGFTPKLTLNRVLFKNHKRDARSSNKKKRMGNSTNKSDVELLEDLTDVTLKFVPVYEKTVAKVVEQVQNPQMQMNGQPFNQNTSYEINRIDQTEQLRQNSQRQRVLSNQETFQYQRQQYQFKLQKLSSPKHNLQISLNRSFKQPYISIQQQYIDLFPESSVQQMGQQSIQDYMDSRVPRRNFNTSIYYSDKKSPQSLNFLMSSPQYWIDKADNAHIELQDWNEQKHKAIKQKIQNHIDYQEGRRNRFMLREILHKGIWKYKYEDFKKPGSRTKSNVVNKVQQFQQMFDDAIAPPIDLSSHGLDKSQFRDLIMDKEDELFSI